MLLFCNNHSYVHKNQLSMNQLMEQEIDATEDVAARL